MTVYLLFSEVDGDERTYTEIEGVFSSEERANARMRELPLVDDMHKGARGNKVLYWVKDFEVDDAGV